ncbi:UDP-xylose and UDP-N-acetylglucosamine transporter, partial [Armadillidium vulgare]
MNQGVVTLSLFSQFLFIALHGFIFTSKFGRKPHIIPIKDYLVLVGLFFIVNLTNNLAFDFKISIPLHIIFRSGGLIASMIMGMVVLGRRYTVLKYASVVMITIGTIVCTLASAENISENPDNYQADFITWLQGIFILTFALFLSARMGIYQECLYTKYGKHPKEALFYIHALSIPAFLLTSPSIYEHVLKFNASSPLPELATIPYLSTIPRLWLYLLGNTLTQYICIGSVFTLTSECAALTVTLVLTLRKFMSLLFSIFYFSNPFTLYHWMGSFLVFGGTLAFSDIFSKSKVSTTKKTQKKRSILKTYATVPGLKR